MIQRQGEVSIQMLENVQQKTIEPIIKQTIAPDTLIYTDEYNIYGRLQAWGYCKALDLLDTDLGVIQRPRRTGLGVFPDAPERAFCSHDAARSTAHYRRA